MCTGKSNKESTIRILLARGADPYKAVSRQVEEDEDADKNAFEISEQYDHPHLKEILEQNNLRTRKFNKLHGISQ